MKRHITRPNLRFGSVEEPQATREFSGPMPSACRKLLEFFDAQNSQPAWRTSLDDVPPELRDWDAIEYCRTQDWIVFSPDLTFWITRDGRRALKEHILYSRLQQEDAASLGKGPPETAIVVEDMPGRPRGNPALEVRRVVSNMTTDTAKICGPALVSFFRVVEDLSASEEAGDYPAWRDVQTSYFERSSWKGRLTGVKTLRDYARRIGRSLTEGNLAGFWHHTSEGVRWR